MYDRVLVLFKSDKKYLVLLLIPQDGCIHAECSTHANGLMIATGVGLGRWCSTLMTRTWQQQVIPRTGSP